jgi:inhibitor of KinA sporulation pathway (predicted exonuclease)
MNPETTLLIIDLEATCWRGHPPSGQQSEIIEIGICPLDVVTLAHPPQGDSLLVRPTRSTISEFCTTLTTLTQAQVDDGISFAAACQTLRERYHSTEVVWASWGEYDRKMFERQCELFDVHYPFNKRHYNLKSVLSGGRKRGKQMGMASMLRHLALKLEGTHHRGSDDAYNIARIAAAHLGAAHAVGKDFSTYFPKWRHIDEPR